MNASYTERNILNSEFGDNRWINGYFKLGDRQTRRFAIVLHISTIGLHGPFGYVISRSADNEAPDDELPLHYLVGAGDAKLFGAFRVGEPDQEISASVRLSTATGKDLGEFDIPPLAEFILKDVRNVLVSDEPREKRFAQFFFCAPSSVWPRLSGTAYRLDGDGSFVTEKQPHVVQAANGKIRVTVEPWARYSIKDNNQLGPEFFRQMYASPRVLGEQSTKLILNAPQAALLIEPTDPEMSDKVFATACDGVAETLRIGFSFLVGARCYWHTRALQTSEMLEEFNAGNGVWDDHVPFNAREFPVGDYHRELGFTYEDFFKHMVDFGVSGQAREQLASYVESYVACLVPTNRRDCFTLACLFLEELSRSYWEWIAPRGDWLAFVREAVGRFPMLNDERLRSSLSSVVQTKFAQRLLKWASEHQLYVDDLGPEPFSEIVRVRNKIVHGTDQPPSDDEISLQLSRAMTLLDRFILKQLGWTQQKPIREFAVRTIYRALHEAESD